MARATTAKAASQVRVDLSNLFLWLLRTSRPGPVNSLVRLQRNDAQFLPSRLKEAGGIDGQRPG